MNAQSHLVQYAALAAGAVLAAAAPSSAQMTAVSLDRHMHGETTIWSALCPPPGGDADSADLDGPPGLEPWNGSLVVESNMCGSSQSQWIRGVSTQHSTMSPSEFQFTATAGFVRTEFQSMSQATSSTQSSCSLGFHIRAATSYSLTGVASGGWVQFFGPEGVIYQGPFSSGPFSLSGTFIPGDYSLVCVTQLDWSYYAGGPLSGETSLGVTLSVSPPECPCDWHADGALNSGDFFAFLDDFFRGEADYDFSGATDSQDFFSFLGCFFAGCA